MQTWNNRLFELYAQQPAPGFAKVSQAQLLRADRHAFVRMAETFTGTLKPSGNVRPLDDIFEKLHTDVSVTYFLLPMPSSASSSHDKHGDQSKPSSSTTSEPKKRPADHTDAKASQGGNQKFKKGKGKGSFKNNGDPVPSALKGMHSRTPRENLFAVPGIWASVTKATVVPESMCVASPGVTANTLNRNINDKIFKEFHFYRRAKIFPRKNPLQP